MLKAMFFYQLQEFNSVIARAKTSSYTWRLGSLSNAARMIFLLESLKLEDLNSLNMLESCQSVRDHLSINTSCNLQNLVCTLLFYTCVQGQTQFAKRMTKSIKMQNFTFSTKILQTRNKANSYYYCLFFVFRKSFERIIEVIHVKSGTNACLKNNDFSDFFRNAKMHSK